MKEKFSNYGIASLPMYVYYFIQVKFTTYLLFSASSVSVLGQDFRPGVTVCLQAPCDDDYPKFARVMHVLVPEEFRLLLVRVFNTESYSQHHNAYCVTMTSHYAVIRIDELALHDIFNIYILSSISYVVVRSCCHIELFV